jgi:hypothetical protein
VDIQTRRKKQQELMVRIVERRVRARARELYQERGEAEGHALKDWFQAETEVLKKTKIASVYRKLKSASQQENTSSQTITNATPCESPA